MVYGGSHNTGGDVVLMKLIIPGEPQEIWKDINGYEEIYRVSNLGRIKSLQRTFIKRDNTKCTVREAVLKCSKDANGYVFVRLSRNFKKQIFKVHRLVALHFIVQAEGKDQVNHIDGDKLNNAVVNLEWCNNKENRIHAVNSGLVKLGEKSKNSKLTNKQVQEIRNTFVKGDPVNGAKPLARKYGVSDMHIRNIVKGNKRRAG